MTEPPHPENLAEAPEKDVAEKRPLLRPACVCIDLESNPQQGNRIFKIAALRPDTGESVSLADDLTAPAVKAALDRLSAGARFVLGHHIREHDLPLLEAQYPGLHLLTLPTFDTLALSPIAFPLNPYHRLVKDYKLVSDSRNDPLSDAALTVELYQDEHDAIEQLARKDPFFASVLHALIGDESVEGKLLRKVRQALAPPLEGLAASLLPAFADLACSTQLSELATLATTAPPIRAALPYALSWIRVAGGNSILPPWVHHSVPEVGAVVQRLREQDCGEAACRYCRSQFDPEALLERFFNLPGFRPLPANPAGGSLQRDIVAGGLARQSLLAVLPTGGGKSICYQLPALAHYARSGRLTVIVSPLQSLMKDQVDNLVARGIMSAVAINGLLTPPERRAALDRIRLGDVSMVFVSPEQFRNRSFAEAIRWRQIATWVFDEAHCLSKWGHDFRTDYLYVSRFIRENFSGQQAPVACFTATAKPDVIEDLVGHFRKELGIELEQLLGGHERTNLEYSVVFAAKAEKPQKALELIQRHMGEDGAAVVFCATRKNTATVAELLSQAGLRCAHFHGALDAGLKKQIQQEFISGELQVIAATNAFGMGVDKPDIRVVVHMDIPGSLENYLQEAGRAGRDGQPAKCVLLFDEHDVETQFRLAASSRLTQKDFAGLLKAVRRRADKLRSDEIVVSAHELLDEADSEVAIEHDDSNATTKVATAVAWLERGGFLRRDENQTRVFAASLRIATLDEARKRLAQADIPKEKRQVYEQLTAALFDDLTGEGFSTDELMIDRGISPQECFRVLYALEKLGILSNDLGLRAAVTKGGRYAADTLLQRTLQLERCLLDTLVELAPGADVDGTEQQLSLRLLCAEVRDRLSTLQEPVEVLPEELMRCLRTFAQGFGEGQAARSMLTMRKAGPDLLRVRLNRTWGAIRSICEKRQAVAQVVLGTILSKFAPGQTGTLLVECKANELTGAIEHDVALNGLLTDIAVALEQALLFLHETKVIVLDKGRTIFRSAMTLRLDPAQKKRRFVKDDFAGLQEHYDERNFQIHVMHEYARQGVQRMAGAMSLMAAYFAWPKRRFVREYFRGRTELLELATTDESYRRIVTELNNTVQQDLVEKPPKGNRLVLAGPGSGKTRVVVHRVAYLLRVLRVAASRIIVLTFNRGAAMEVRQRLLALVGDEARGITVLTYHAMAMRLTGTSFAGLAASGTAVDFDGVLRSAVALLQGRHTAFGDADEVRDRLLQGYEFILVDEYQDINALQYELISALAGRTLADDDAKLSVMAVGDDDQNIYEFNGADVEFIRRFQRDYPGELHFLVENFRSTQHIITVANEVIQRGRDRMKVDHPIRIDAGRAGAAPGGRLEELDLLGQGRVRIVEAPADANRQAQLVWREIERLREIDPDVKWSDIAVLARHRSTLEPLRTLCELHQAGYRLLAGADTAAAVRLTQTRQGRRVLDVLEPRRTRLVRPKALERWLQRLCLAHPQDMFYAELLDIAADLKCQAGGAAMPGAEVIEQIHEASASSRFEARPHEIQLSTTHAVKGREFQHVILMNTGDWAQPKPDERRLLYVAMTRARQTLTLLRMPARPSMLSDLESSEAAYVVEAPDDLQHDPRLEAQHRVLTLADVDMDFSGRHPPEHPVHAAIARLVLEEPLEVRERGLYSQAGVLVGRLARSMDLSGVRIRDAKVHGIVVRQRAQVVDPRFSAQLKVDRWETVLCELWLESGRSP